MEQVSDQQIMSDDSEHLVPVAESIRYRKRAQAAEKQLETLNQQLKASQSQCQQLETKLNDTALDNQLVRKLAAANAIDLDTAALVVRQRIDETHDADMDTVIEEIKTEKPYLFLVKGDFVEPVCEKTRNARSRIDGGAAQLEKAAKKAAASGSRKDLHQYLKLRRSAL